MATLIKGRKQEEAIAFAQSQYNAVWVNYPNGSCGWEVKGMSDDTFRQALGVGYEGKYLAIDLHVPAGSLRAR